MLKAAVLADAAREPAEYALAALADHGDESPTAAFARSLAALVLGDDDAALVASAGMRANSDAFRRAADAVEALARRDQGDYESAVSAIVRDFERRDGHLTGVPIADTAVMLQRLAAERGLCAAVTSPVLPPAAG